MSDDGKPLSAFQLRALEAIREAGEQGHTGRSLAYALWPDSPAWGMRAKGRRTGTVSGALGGTMPMKGARIAHELATRNLVRVERTDWGQPIFTLTQTGRELLDA